MKIRKRSKDKIIGCQLKLGKAMTTSRNFTCWTSPYIIAKIKYCCKNEKEGAPNDTPSSFINLKNYLFKA